MKKAENKRLAGKLKGVITMLSNEKLEIKSEQVDGYELLMSIIDRKVFDVEDSRVTGTDFNKLTQWAVSKFNTSEDVCLSGRVVMNDPLVIIEVIEEEPVFIEIHDYNVRYRVNLFHETQDVDVQVMEPVKDKELVYVKTNHPVYVF